MNFVYDEAGRLVEAQQEVVLFGESYTTGLQYEVDAQAHTQTRRLTYPGASADVVETYDGRGRLESIVYGTRELVGASSYDDADRLTARSLGNGTSSSYTYDPNGWVQQIEYVKDTLTLEHIGYGYDNVGNVTYRQVATPGREHLSELYEYDRLHRLTRYDRGVLNAEKTAVTEPAPRPFAQTRQWNNLDLLGNWLATDTTIGNEAPVTDTRTANAANEYLTRQIGQSQQINLVSDDNGNLTTNGSQKYVYDAENRLIKVQKASDDSHIQWYWYDALGRRVAMWYNTMVVGDDLFAYVYADGAACLAEYYTGGTENTLTRQYIHGPGFPDPLVMIDLTDKGDQPQGEEEYLYYLKDLLGSVTALANSNGAIVERYVYDPYGNTTVETASYYHDADLDGDVDESDEAHFQGCFDSSDPLCVFVHDRTGDNRVDIDDYGYFAGCSTTNGVSPGAECARWSSTYFDPDNDGDVDLYDFAGFQECMGADDALCRFIYDADDDMDIDHDDFAKFNSAMGDSGILHPVIADHSRYGNPFLWTGQRYDAPVGLYHFLYRSYLPTLGRWLQRDPLGYVDGASLYEYVRSNPIRWNDPSGLWPPGSIPPGAIPIIPRPSKPLPSNPPSESESDTYPDWDWLTPESIRPYFPPHIGPLAPPITGSEIPVEAPKKPLPGCPLGPSFEPMPALPQFPWVEPDDPCFDYWQCLQTAQDDLDDCYRQEKLQQRVGGTGSALLVFFGPIGLASSLLGEAGSLINYGWDLKVCNDNYDKNRLRCVKRFPNCP